MLKEFKEFISKGNVIDLAIGVIIGSAFGKIVTSLVNDIIMPPIGLLLKEVNFKDLYINLSGQSYPSLEEAAAAGVPTINYGMFLNTIIEFFIIALVLFLVVKAINKTRVQKAEEHEATAKTCPFCQSSIAIKAVRCPHCTSELP